jgi:hypothetical protein
MINEFFTGKKELKSGKCVAFIYATMKRHSDSGLPESDMHKKHYADIQQVI